MMCMDVYMHEYDMYKYLRTSGGGAQVCNATFRDLYSDATSESL